MAQGRTKNFSDSEKYRLLSVIKVYRNVIENIKTNPATAKLKSEVWEELAVSFNALGGNPMRSAQQLKMCYSNMKRWSKWNTISKRHDKVELSKTSGCSSLLDINPTKLCITSVVEDQLHPLYHPRDSDAMCSDNIDKVNLSGEKIIELPETMTHTEDNVQTKAEKNYHLTQPITVQAPPHTTTTSTTTINPLLSTPSDPAPSKETRRNEEIADMASKKSKVLRRHLETVNEQHSIKMKILHNQLESSKLALENQKLENKIKKATLLKLIVEMQ